MEYQIVKFDEDQRQVRLSLRAGEVLDALNNEDAEALIYDATPGAEFGFAWHPEYASYMVEATPGKPLIGIKDLALVEGSMAARRAKITSVLQPGEEVLSLTNFPLLGVEGQFEAPAGGEFGDSDYVPDAVTFNHPRFFTMTRNIRTRRGGKVDIRAPVFQDKNTKTEEVHMDHQVFGMGMNCLQVTVQTEGLTPARRVYDQMAAVGPVLLALSAATPILKGHLVDTDARWNYIGMSVDDRTDAERGVATGTRAQPSPGGWRREATPQVEVRHHFDIHLGG